jgi:transglutaminase-like putative cysteine protease
VSELWDRVRYPRAGWLSLGLLAVMALSVAWSVQEVQWLDQLEYLAPLALWAVLSGALIGVVRVSILISLPLAALLGAGFVLWAIGGEYFTPLSQLGRLEALRNDAIGFTLALLDGGYPSQMSPYAIGLGILMWTSAFMASYVVYRYHRVIDAIIVLGAAIVTNMSAALTGLGNILIFVIAALLLWLRAALVTRQDGWQRRRVNENVEVPAQIMRTGIIFAAGSVILAYVLTAVAVAAPLTGAWRNLDVVWTGVRDQLEGVVGGLTNPNSRITGSSFGPSFIVSGEWVSNNDPVLVLAAERPMYLRTRTHDIYTGRGWDSTGGEKRGVAAGDALFTVPTPERPTVNEGEGVRFASISIEMRQSVGRQIFTAGSPLKVYAPALITEPAGLPILGAIEAANAIGEGESYEQAILISEATEAQLIATAGIDYPQAIKDLYTSTRNISPRVAELARTVTEGEETPYEQAKALVSYLRSADFTYDTGGLDVPTGADLVETFLFADNGKIGYCQHFASAMAVMARSLGLPARVATGWAPGEPSGEDLWLVREVNAHAWVEIYFPGYGWQIFEPTKGVDPLFRARGTDGPPIDRDPSQGIDPWFAEDLERLRQQGQVFVLPSANPVEGAIDPANPEVVEPADDQSREGNAVVMIVLLAAAATFIFFQARRSRRRWRLLPAGDRAWQHLTLAADRAGVGPRPSETIYEYAGWLEEQLPRHGEPIRVVADGKVWQNYSGRPLTRSGANRLEVAWSRLRRPLMMLGLRRRLRRLARRDHPAT